MPSNARSFLEGALGATIDPWMDKLFQSIEDHLLFQRQARRLLTLCGKSPIPIPIEKTQAERNAEAPQYISYQYGTPARQYWYVNTSSYITMTGTNGSTF